MSKWKTLLIAALTSPLLCSALTIPDIEVDYLYWGTWNNELLWSTTRTGPFTFNTQSHNYLVPAYRSGVKGGLSMDLSNSCLHMTGRYYFVNYYDSAEVTSPGGLTTLLIAGSNSANPGAVARIDQDMPYHSADLFLDWSVFSNGCANLAIQAGGSFAYSRQTIGIKLVDSIADRTFLAAGRTRFSGGGPRIGISGEFCVGRMLTLETEVGLATLFGEATNTWFQRANTVYLKDFNLQTGSTVTANLQFRVGAKYHHPFRCACAALSVGWEQRNYFNYTSPLSGLQDDLGPGVPTLEGLINDIVFGGPYLGVSATF